MFAPAMFLLPLSPNPFGLTLISFAKLEKRITLGIAFVRKNSPAVLFGERATGRPPKAQKKCPLGQRVLVFVFSALSLTKMLAEMKQTLSSGYIDQV